MNQKNNSQEYSHLIKDGFFICPHDSKKIQPIYEKDTINGTVYCDYCKSYWHVVIANNEILKCEKVNLEK